MALLDHYGVPITGKKVAVIGHSCVVGLPTQLFLMDRGATVTNCDINTTGLHKIIQSSNIVHRRDHQSWSRPAGSSPWLSSLMSDSMLSTACATRGKECSVLLALSMPMLTKLRLLLHPSPLELVP